MASPCRPVVGGHVQDKQAGGCQVLSFWTAEEQGRIAATLTHVNVKVHVVAGDGGDAPSRIAFINILGRTISRVV